MQLSTPAPQLDEERHVRARARVKVSMRPPAGRMHVSTLTPVLNEERHIRAVIANLQAQEAADAAEFIFIDGRSTDRTREILHEHAASDPRIRILDNPARHTAAALNIGLRAARGEYVARIDAHTQYPPNYLSRGIERLQRGDVDWVTGPQIPRGSRSGGTTGTWSGRVALALATPLATGDSSRWESDVERRGADEVELSTGVFCGIWRRAILDGLGGWDEGWPINQDSELAARVLRAGGRIISLPELGAQYMPRDSLGRLGRQYLRYGMYRAKTALRHPWTVRPPHVALPGLVVAGACAVAGPRALRPSARAGLGVYALALARYSLPVIAVNTRDALTLPAVFATMHASWGAGYLVGLIRFSMPSRRRLALATDLLARAEA